MSSRDQCIAKALNELHTDSDTEGDEPNLREDPARPWPVVAIVTKAGENDMNDGARELESQRAKAGDFDCNCQLLNGGSCSARYTVDDFVNSQCEMIELTREERDMVILGQIRCFTTKNEQTVASRRKEQKRRERQRSSFLFHGEPVCMKTFLFLHSMSHKKLCALQKHYRDNGCRPRVHANSGKSFPNHLSFDDRVSIRNFIGNYAETHAVSLPGRIPGCERDDLQLLPSSETKANVWRRYKLAMEESGNRVVGLSTFRKVWNALCQSHDDV